MKTLFTKNGDSSRSGKDFQLLNETNPNQENSHVSLSLNQHNRTEQELQNYTFTMDNAADVVNSIGDEKVNQGLNSKTFIQKKKPVSNELMKPFIKTNENEKIVNQKSNQNQNQSHIVQPENQNPSILQQNQQNANNQPSVPCLERIKQNLLNSWDQFQKDNLKLRKFIRIFLLLLIVFGLVTSIYIYYKNGQFIRRNETLQNNQRIKLSIESCTLSIYDYSLISTGLIDENFLGTTNIPSRLDDPNYAYFNLIYPDKIFSKKSSSYMKSENNGENQYNINNSFSSQSCEAIIFIYKPMTFDSFKIDCGSISQCNIIINTSLATFSDLNIYGYNVQMNAPELITNKFEFKSSKGHIEIPNFTFSIAKINTREGDIAVQSTKGIKLTTYQKDPFICISSAGTITEPNTSTDYTDITFQQQFENASTSDCKSVYPYGGAEKAETLIELRCIKSEQQLNMNGSAPQVLEAQNSYGNIFVNVISNKGSFPNEKSSLNNVILFNKIRIGEDKKQNVQSYINFSKLSNNNLVNVTKAASNPKVYDPIFMLQFGPKYTRSDSSQQVQVTYNPAYSYMRPWWLGTLTLTLMTTQKYQGSYTIAPGFCPYIPTQSLLRMYKTQQLVRDFMVSNSAPITLLVSNSWPSDKAIPTQEYESTDSVTGFRSNSESKFHQDLWLSININEEQILSVTDLDVEENCSLFFAIIVSLILSMILSTIIMILVVYAINVNYQSIMSHISSVKQYSIIDEHKTDVSSPQPKMDNVNDKTSEEIKNPDTIDEIFNADIEYRFSFTSIYNLFKQLMNYTPPISAFIDYMIHLLFKAKINSIEQFYEILFLKSVINPIKGEQLEVNEDIHNLEKDNIDGQELKSLYEKYCYLNSYLERSFDDETSIKLLKQKGFKIVNETKFDIQFLTRIKFKGPIKVVFEESSQCSLDLFFSEQCSITNFETDQIEATIFQNKYSEFCEKNHMSKIELNQDLLKRKYGIEIVLFPKQYLSRDDSFSIKDHGKYLIQRNLVESHFKIILNQDDDSQQKVQAIHTFNYPNWWRIYDFFLVICHVLIMIAFGSPVLLITIAIRIQQAEYSILPPQHLIYLETLQYYPTSIPAKLLDDSFLINVVYYLSLYIWLLFFINLWDYYQKMVLPIESYFFQWKQRMTFPKLQIITWFIILLSLYVTLLYISLVIIWLMLGAIINPNAFLPYATSAATFVTLVTNKFREFKQIYENGFEVLEIYFSNLAQNQFKDFIGKLKIQEKIVDMIPINSIKSISAEASKFGIIDPSINEQIQNNLEVMIRDPSIASQLGNQLEQFTQDPNVYVMQLTQKLEEKAKIILFNQIPLTNEVLKEQTINLLWSLLKNEKCDLKQTMHLFLNSLIEQFLEQQDKIQEQQKNFVELISPALNFVLEIVFYEKNIEGDHIDRITEVFCLTLSQIVIGWNKQNNLLSKPQEDPNQNSQEKQNKFDSSTKKETVLAFQNIIFAILQISKAVKTQNDEGIFNGLISLCEQTIEFSGFEKIRQIKKFSHVLKLGITAVNSKESIQIQDIISVLKGLVNDFGLENEIKQYTGVSILDIFKVIEIINEYLQNPSSTLNYQEIKNTIQNVIEKYYVFQEKNKLINQEIPNNLNYAILDDQNLNKMIQEIQEQKKEIQQQISFTNQLEEYCKESQMFFIEEARNCYLSFIKNCQYVQVEIIEANINNNQALLREIKNAAAVKEDEYNKFINLQKTQKDSFKSLKKQLDDQIQPKKIGSEFQIENNVFDQIQLTIKQIQTNQNDNDSNKNEFLDIANLRVEEYEQITQEITKIQKDKITLINSLIILEDVESKILIQLKEIESNNKQQEIPKYSWFAIGFTFMLIIFTGSLHDIPITMIQECLQILESKDDIKTKLNDLAKNKDEKNIEILQSVIHFIEILMNDLKANVSQIEQIGLDFGIDLKIVKPIKIILTLKNNGFVKLEQINKDLKGSDLLKSIESVMKIEQNILLGLIEIITGYKQSQDVIQFFNYIATLNQIPKSKIPKIRHIYNIYTSVDPNELFSSLSYFSSIEVEQVLNQMLYNRGILSKRVFEEKQKKQNIPSENNSNHLNQQQIEKNKIINLFLQQIKISGPLYESELKEMNVLLHINLKDQEISFLKKLISLRNIIQKNENLSKTKIIDSSIQDILDILKVPYLALDNFFTLFTSNKFDNIVKSLKFFDLQQIDPELQQNNLHKFIQYTLSIQDSFLKRKTNIKQINKVIFDDKVPLCLLNKVLLNTNYEFQYDDYIQICMIAGIHEQFQDLIDFRFGLLSLTDFHKSILKIDTFQDLLEKPAQKTICENIIKIISIDEKEVWLQKFLQGLLEKQDEEGLLMGSLLAYFGGQSKNIELSQEQDRTVEKFNLQQLICKKLEIQKEFFESFQTFFEEDTMNFTQNFIRLSRKLEQQLQIQNGDILNNNVTISDFIVEQYLRLACGKSINTSFFAKELNFPIELIELLSCLQQIKTSKNKGERQIAFSNLKTNSSIGNLLLKLKVNPSELITLLTLMYEDYDPTNVNWISSSLKLPLRFPIKDISQFLQFNLTLPELGDPKINKRILDDRIKKSQFVKSLNLNQNEKNKELNLVEITYLFSKGDFTLFSEYKNNLWFTIRKEEKFQNLIYGITGTKSIQTKKFLRQIYRIFDSELSKDKKTIPDEPLKGNTIDYAIYSFTKATNFSPTWILLMMGDYNTWELLAKNYFFEKKDQENNYRTNPFLALGFVIYFRKCPIQLKIEISKESKKDNQNEILKTQIKKLFSNESTVEVGHIAPSQIDLLDQTWLKEIADSIGFPQRVITMLNNYQTRDKKCVTLTLDQLDHVFISNVFKEIDTVFYTDPRRNGLSYQNSIREMSILSTIAQLKGSYYNFYGLIKRDEMHKKKILEAINFLQVELFNQDDQKNLIILVGLSLGFFFTLDNINDKKENKDKSNEQDMKNLEVLIDLFKENYQELYHNNYFISQYKEDTNLLFELLKVNGYMSQARENIKFEEFQSTIQICSHYFSSNTIALSEILGLLVSSFPSSFSSAIKEYSLPKEKVVNFMNLCFYKSDDKQSEIDGLLEKPKQNIKNNEVLKNTISAYLGDMSQHLKLLEFSKFFFPEKKQKEQDDKSQQKLVQFLKQFFWSFEKRETYDLPKNYLEINYLDFCHLSYNTIKTEEEVKNFFTKICQQLIDKKQEDRNNLETITDYQQFDFFFNNWNFLGSSKSKMLKNPNSFLELLKTYLILLKPEKYHFEIGSLKDFLSLETTKTFVEKFISSNKAIEQKMVGTFFDVIKQFINGDLKGVINLIVCSLSQMNQSNVPNLNNFLNDQIKNFQVKNTDNLAQSKFQQQLFSFIESVSLPFSKILSKIYQYCDTPFYENFKFYQDVIGLLDCFNTSLPLIQQETPFLKYLIEYLNQFYKKVVQVELTDKFSFDLDLKGLEKNLINTIFQKKEYLLIFNQLILKIAFENRELSEFFFEKKKSSEMSKENQENLILSISDMFQIILEKPVLSINDPDLIKQVSKLIMCVGKGVIDVSIFENVFSILCGEHIKVFTLMKKFKIMDSIKINQLEKVFLKVQEMPIFKFSPLTDKKNEDQIKKANRIKEIVKKLIEGQVNQVSIQDVFQAVDNEGDGNGKISVYEFQQFVRRLGMELTTHRVKEIIASVKSQSSVVFQSNVNSEELVLNLEEFEKAWNYIQEKKTKMSLEMLGISPTLLAISLGLLIIVLILLFAFIFLGINAFTVGGTFGSIVNSIIPVLAAGGVARSSENKQDKLKDIETISKETQSIIHSNKM